VTSAHLIEMVELQGPFSLELSSIEIWQMVLATIHIMTDTVFGITFAGPGLLSQ